MDREVLWQKSISESSTLLWYLQNGGNAGGFNGTFIDKYNLISNFFNCTALADLGVTWTSISNSINAGEAIMATLWPPGATSGHEVFITGYNNDGSVVYYDPETGAYVSTLPGNFIRVVAISGAK